MILCDYGCGQEAKYQFKNGKWCCSKNISGCPFIKDKKINDETKKKMSISSTGKKHTQETKEKIGRKHKGKKLSTKTKQKISEANKGNISWSKGKKLSKKTKQKISEANKGNRHSKELIKKISMKNKLSIKQYKERHPLFFKIEEIRYKPKYEEEKIIQAHCKNHKCKNSKEKDGWFSPTSIQISERIRQLESIYANGGNYFYCCDECKQECPLFNLHSDPNKTIDILYTSEEYQTWRKEVLKREDCICEYCEKKATHVHHSRPQKLEPGFALDPDFGVACCQECHYKYGHKTGTECSTGNLASKECF